MDVNKDTMKKQRSNNPGYLVGIIPMTFAGFVHHLAVRREPAARALKPWLGSRRASARDVARKIEAAARAGKIDAVTRQFLLDYLRELRERHAGDERIVGTRDPKDWEQCNNGYRRRVHRRSGEGPEFDEVLGDLASGERTMKYV